MVGVGGRSGGCHTCRRRRVKCDEVHPTCERCAKAKIKCEGYARDLKFVDEKGRAQKRVQVKRQAYLENVRAEERRLRTGRQARLEPTNRPMGSIGKVLSPAGMREKVPLQYTLNYLFAGWRLFMPWVMKAYRGTDDCTTTQTVKALSCAYYGRMHNDRKTFDSGMASYCNALRLLGSDLTDPKTAYSISSVTNVLVLCIFEMLASSKGGLLQHLGGVQRLIEARGPERHQDQPDLDVFESARFGMIHQYMEKKKRCFLEEPQWTTIPWIKHPEAKTLLSQITDRKAHVSGLLEDMEAIRTGERASPADFEYLYQQLITQLHELYTWRAAWEAEYPDCCWTVPMTNPKMPFASAIYFKTMARAVEIGHYNTILLTFYRIGRMLKGPMFSVTTPATSIPVIRTNPPLMLPIDPKTVQDVGVEFLRLIPFELMQPNQNGGYFQALHPIRATFEVFKPGSKEWDYCHSTLIQIAEDGGFELGRRMMPNGLRGRMLYDEWINT